ncbi:MAG TPA: DegT/DnrJ/EryC1/StrS family aminotransferase [Candidatus Angelobacter sp.]
MNNFSIPVYSSWISDEDVEAVKRVAADGWISSTGPEVQRFENDFADFIGADYAISTSNGTTALHLALTGLGIGPGDEVIVPDLTFIASAATIAQTGATPVFADVSRADWNITVEEVLRKRTPRTRAVLPVHLYGNPADCEAIAEAVPDLLMIEDAAEACGASRNGRKTGTFGTAGAFSFYANKVITTGEGGMVVTGDRQLAERLRVLRGHGMAPDRKYFHPELGFNYRMTALQAAIGRSQLQRIDTVLALKRKIASWYEERLAEIPQIELHAASTPEKEGVYWMYSILLPDSATRERVMDALAEDRIETRPFFLPMSTLPPFRQQSAEGLPVSLDLSRRGMNLPSSPLLTEEEVDRVCDGIRTALGMAAVKTVFELDAKEAA